MRRSSVRSALGRPRSLRRGGARAHRIERAGQGGAVVVGVDQTPMSQFALQVAIEASSTHDCPLRIVHAYDRISYIAGYPPAQHARSAAPGRQILDRAVWLAGDQLGADQVSGVQVAGRPLAVLLGQSEGARLLVIGTPTHQVPAATLVGSVGAGLIAAASCPVVVARPYLTPPFPGAAVVAGVDGSVPARQALGFAFAEADARHLPLVAVHCVDTDADAARISRTPADSLWLEQSLAHYTRRYPGVTVMSRRRRGDPARVLANLSLGAPLLVVGARSHGYRTGVVLGSVTQQLLHEACCPVAVI